MLCTMPHRQHQDVLLRIEAGRNRRQGTASLKRRPADRHAAAPWPSFGPAAGFGGLLGLFVLREQVDTDDPSCKKCLRAANKRTEVS